MQGYYEIHRDDQAHASAWYVENDHFAPHFHNSVELMYVLEGELDAVMDGEAYTAGAGTLLIASSYVIHAYATRSHSRSIVAIIPMAEVPDARALLAKKAFASRACADDADFTLRTLLSMMAAARAQSPLVMKGLCYAVLGTLMERVGLTDARASSRTEFIREVLDYLQQHHAEPLDVRRVAAHFGYSRSRFSHIFNSHLRCSLSDYVGALRCQHAAQLLREGGTSVSDIALAVGFESLRTFYRVFHKQYEMTPQRYARA